MLYAERVGALEARIRELEATQGQVHGESTKKLTGIETAYQTLKVSGRGPQFEVLTAVGQLMT